jgi:hypothetical protein
MLAKLRPRSAYDVMAALALFVAISTGGAYAANTVFSEDIVDGEVKTPDLGSGAVTRTKIGNGEVIRDKINNNAVNTTKVADNALTGLDIDESTLGQVPSAVLGGMGRWRGGVSCDPETTTFVDCGFVSLDLPVGDSLDPQPRVLITGAVGASQESGGSDAQGGCRLATSLNTPLFASEVTVLVGNSTAPQNAPPASGATIPLTAVTPPLPSDRPSRVDFGVECNQYSLGAIRYHHVQVSAVALSPN